MPDRKLKILAIDADTETLASLGAAFQAQNWEFSAAKDVPTGVERFRTEAPDLVLVEYRLSGLDGVSGVRMLRELDGSVPIIAVTSEDSRDVAARFFEAGASDFALKPIRALDFISRIGLHIKLSERSCRLHKKDAFPVPDSKAKGIGASTLELIRGAFRTSTECLTVETVAERTGLAYQTTYRYLQHLTMQELVEVSHHYGKIGRPKQTYRLRARNSAG